MRSNYAAFLSRFTFNFTVFWILLLKIFNDLNRKDLREVHNLKVLPMNFLIFYWKRFKLYTNLKNGNSETSHSIQFHINMKLNLHQIYQMLRNHRLANWNRNSKGREMIWIATLLNFRRQRSTKVNIMQKRIDEILRFLSSIFSTGSHLSDFVQRIKSFRLEFIYV